MTDQENKSNLKGITSLLYDNKLNVVINSYENSLLIRIFYNFDYITSIKPKSD